MTIQQLEYILEVNRAGSMSRAAKNLFVSHSSVSNSVAALEEELGFPIFERNYQGVVPTARGHEVLEHAAQVCEHLRRMRDGKSQLSRRIRIETTIPIAAPMLCCVCWMSAADGTICGFITRPITPRALPWTNWPPLIWIWWYIPACPTSCTNSKRMPPGAAWNGSTLASSPVSSKSGRDTHCTTNRICPP